MIYFRDVTAPRADGGTYWTIEHFQADNDGEPLGSHPNGLAFVSERDGAACMDCVFVAHQWRERGIASALALAIVRRWPACTAAATLDDWGEHLLDQARKGVGAEAPA